MDLQRPLKHTQQLKKNIDHQTHRQRGKVKGGVHQLGEPLEQKLPDNSGGSAVTAAAFAKMSYAQRLDLYKTDKETYDTLTGRKGE